MSLQTALLPANVSHAELIFNEKFILGTALDGSVLVFEAESGTLSLLLDHHESTYPMVLITPCS